MTHGILSGEKCNRDGCEGLMVAVDSDSSCSCHINPPCGHCVNMEFECSHCGFLVEGPEQTYTSSHKAIKPQQIRKSYSQLFEELEDGVFGYITISGKYYWMEAKGKCPVGMEPSEILKEFNTCFGYKWLKIPKNGEFHLKYYTD